jgi:hypothetical protein
MGQVDDQSVNTARPIARDIPCVSCGYDLRGLYRDGRCPECAHPVSESVEIWRLKDRRKFESLTLADAAWIREVSESAILGAVTFVLLLVLVFAPESAYERKSSSRVVMLAVACSAWVVAGHAVRKLTIRERGAYATLGFGRKSRFLLRWGFAPCFLVPFCVPLITDIRINDTVTEAILVIVGMILLAAFFSSGVTYYLRVGHLLRRASSRRLAWLARGLAVANVLVTFASFAPTFSHDESSLAALLSMPIVQYGAPEIWMEMKEACWRLESANLRSLIDWLEIAIAAVFPSLLACAAVIHILLWTRLRQAYRAALRREAGSGERTDPSFGT